MLAPDPRRAAAERDAARADLCRYLAACYYEPAPAFAEERLFDSMVEAAARIDGDLAGVALRLRDAFQAAPLQDLLIDYTRLFLGPVQALARPYASIWLSGENIVMQQSTLDVQAMYAEGGFDMDEGFQDLPDHIAAELEFLYLLTHRDNEARWSGNVQAATAVGALRRRFLDEHLGRWLGPFLLAMHDGAQSDFYEVLADLTEMLVRREAASGPGAVMAPPRPPPSPAAA